MDARTFLDNFATIAQAPQGVKRLRDLVLDLAVSGGLVGQDPAEGTGRAVVEQGAAFISDAVAKGWSRQRSIPEPTAEEVPFPIPGYWVWARLPSVTHGLGQLTPDQDFTYLDVSSVNGEDGSLNGSPAIIAPDQAPSRARKAVRRGTVLYSTIRPYLRNVVHLDRDFEPPAIASTAFAVLHPVPGLDPRYLKACVRSSYFSRFVESRQKGVAYPAINDGDLAVGLVPVPPLAEQERIVARVDELMGLCDVLEARQERRHRATTRLRASALHALTEARTRDEILTAWARVDARWAELTDDSAGVAELQDALTTLLLSGKLSWQQPEDGTAAELVESARQQRAGLKPTRAKPGRAIETEPYGLPSSWQWAPLGQLTLGMQYGSSARSEVTGEVPVLRMGNLQAGTIDWSALKFTSDPMEIEKYLLPTPSVLFNRTNSPELVGKTAIYRGERPAAFAGYLVRVIPVQGLEPEYLNLVLNSPYARSWCSAVRVDGISQSNISASKLADFPFPLPPTAEQQRIVGAFDRLNRLVSQLACKINDRRDRQLEFAASTTDPGKPAHPY